ncbi:MAG: PQQ-dependent sugar dehydrogenase [Pseudomonadota bacterium]
MKHGIWTLAALTLAACGGGSTGSAAPVAAAAATDEAPAGPSVDVSGGDKIRLPGKPPFDAYAFAEFNEPWAMEFLPDGRLLITEQGGQVLIVDMQGNKSEPLAGVPDVDYGGQGGLGDIVLHPDFETNGIVYLSYAEAGDGNTRGAAVSRGTLRLTPEGGSFEGLEVIWRQVPKVTGRGHYGHRIAFAPDGHLFISSGERQKFDPSQDMSSTMGKMIRLNDDGSVPEDNPFYSEGGETAKIWSLGHRNPLGLAFDGEGNLWNTEMGPRHGDELNFVLPRNNYGYPLVSNGDHYNGDQIPDHDTRPELDAPAAYWVPAISPGSLMIYGDDLFADWNGDAFIGGLGSKALVHVELDAPNAKELTRYPMGKRIRAVEQGPDGAIWLLEDDEGGRLLKLVPKR